jgi:hypothetical protein
VAIAVKDELVKYTKEIEDSNQEILWIELKLYIRVYYGLQ